jgi:hypothetical protein
MAILTLVKSYSKWTLSGEKWVQIGSKDAGSDLNYSLLSWIMLNNLIIDISCFIFVKQHVVHANYAMWSMRYWVYNNTEVLFMFLKTQMSVSAVQY